MRLLPWLQPWQPLRALLLLPLFLAQGLEPLAHWLGRLQLLLWVLLLLLLRLPLLLLLLRWLAAAAATATDVVVANVDVAAPAQPL